MKNKWNEVFKSAWWLKYWNCPTNHAKNHFADFEDTKNIPQFMHATIIHKRYVKWRFLSARCWNYPIAWIFNIFKNRREVRIHDALSQKERQRKTTRITMRGDRHRWDTCVSLHNVTTSFLSGTRYFCHEAILREHFQRNWGKCKPRLAARPLIKNTGIQAKGGYLYFYSSIDHHRPWKGHFMEHRH